MPVEKSKIPNRAFCAHKLQTISVIQFILVNVGKAPFYHFYGAFNIGYQLFLRHTYQRKLLFAVSHVAGIAQLRTYSKIEVTQQVKRKRACGIANAIHFAPNVFFVGEFAYFVL